MMAVVLVALVCCASAWAAPKADKEGKADKTRADAKPRFNEEAYSYDQAKNWDKKGKGYKNPFNPGSYKHFLAAKRYPKTDDFWKDRKLLDKASPKDTSLIIYLGSQRAVLYVKDAPALDFPVCTGKENYATPSGEFVILEKDEDHVSNLYGSIRDGKGKKLHSDAKAGRDKVPKGAAFKGAPMPFFMRLTYGGIGIHVGRVSRVASSHGCIRVLPETCKLVYSKVKEGTPVSILP